jgi:hypothetical protein
VATSLSLSLPLSLSLEPLVPRSKVIYLRAGARWRKKRGNRNRETHKVDFERRHSTRRWV